MDYLKKIWKICLDALVPLVESLYSLHLCAAYSDNSGGLSGGLLFPDLQGQYKSASLPVVQLSTSLRHIVTHILCRPTRMVCFSTDYGCHF